MTAPAFSLVAGQMVREVEPATSPARLELLRIRALKLGLRADITVADYGSDLRVAVLEGHRLLGTITVYAETKDTEERWHLSACCDVMPGLPMQADNLTLNAKRLQFVAAKLLTCDWCGEPGHESEHAGCVAERAASDAEKDETPRTAFDHREDLS